MVNRELERRVRVTHVIQTRDVISRLIVLLPSSALLWTYVPIIPKTNDKKEKGGTENT